MKQPAPWLGPAVLVAVFVIVFVRRIALARRARRELAKLSHSHGETRGPIH